jgi:hypothetical protein
MQNEARGKGGVTYNIVCRTVVMWQVSWVFCMHKGSASRKIMMHLMKGTDVRVVEQMLEERKSTRDPSSSLSHCLEELTSTCLLLMERHTY